MLAVAVLALIVLTEPVGRDLGHDRSSPSVVATDGSPVPDGLVLDGAPRPASYRSLPAPARRDVATNWTVFADSNLWVVDDTVYVVWVDPEGTPLIARHHAGEDGDWELFDLSTIPGNPLAAPGRADPHNTYAVAVDADGYVHVAGNMHSSPLRYIRSTEPGRIDSWTAPGMVGDDEGAVTYPSFTALDDGTLLFSYRDGSSTDGDLVLDTWDGVRWARTATVLGGDGRDAAPYPHRVVAAGDRLHLFHMWRTGRGVEGNAALSYVVSDDAGRTWATRDGRTLTTPVGTRDATVVREASEDLVLVNSGGAAVDRTGRPHALVRVRAGIDGGLWLARPDGDAWRFDRLPGTLDAAGRGVLTVHDRGMLALWPERSGDRVRVMAADVGDGVAHDDPLVLLELPVDVWEPVIARSPGLVHLLVPAGPGDGAGLVTYRLSDLPIGD